MPSIDYEPSYDNLGRITEIDYGASVVNFDYSYVSNESNIYRKTFDHRISDPYNEYSYDDLDRLTGVTYHDSDTEAFNMDELGNRDGNQTLRDDGTVNFVVDDDANRYTSMGGDSITLSAAKSRPIANDAGNLTAQKRGCPLQIIQWIKSRKPEGDLKHLQINVPRTFNSPSPFNLRNRYKTTMHGCGSYKIQDLKLSCRNKKTA